jgi:HPt (histidine-containing phosphotransfer) domain-containing protein
MSANNPGNFPLISGDVFSALQADVNPEVARRYLMQYLQMWDGRYTRLSSAITAGNKEAAVDAVLSVRTSAQMMGALRLAAVAARIEEALAGGETRRAVPLLDELEACGRLTMEELRRRFIPEIGLDGTDRLPKQSETDPGPNSNGWLRRADSLVSVLAPFLRPEPRLN